MPKTRSRRTAEEISTILRRQDESGLSCRKFASLEGLSLASLYSWRQKRSRAPSEGSSSSDPVLRRVALREAPTSTSTMEIQFPSGHLVRLPADVAANRLKDLMAAVEAGCCR